VKVQRVHGLIGAGGAALLVVLAIPAKRRAEVPAPPPVALAVRAAATGVNLAVAATRLEAQRSRTEASEWGRDPFAHEPEPELALAPETVAEPAPAPPAPGPRLGGISRVGTSWLALIDGELAQTGAQLSTGYTVVVITDESVTLRCADGDLTLTLGEAR